MLSLLCGRLVLKGFGTRFEADFIYFFIYFFNLISLSGASFLLLFQMVFNAICFGIVLYKFVS